EQVHVIEVARLDELGDPGPELAVQVGRGDDRAPDTGPLDEGGQVLRAEAAVEGHRYAGCLHSQHGGDELQTVRGDEGHGGGGGDAAADEGVRDPVDPIQELAVGDAERLPPPGGVRHDAAGGAVRPLRGCAHEDLVRRGGQVARGQGDGFDPLDVVRRGELWPGRG